MFDRGGSREKYRDRYDDDAAIDDYNRRFEEGVEINEVDPLTIAGGIGGLIAAAGGLTALEMAADDPEFKAKYPKVANALEKLQALGKAAAYTKRMEEEAKDKEEPLAVKTKAKELASPPHLPNWYLTPEKG